MRLPDKHYVTLGKERVRPHHVVRADATPVRQGGRLVLRYTTVSRHWTWKGACKAARRLNTQEGS